MITLHLIKHNNSSRKPIVKVLQVSIIKHSLTPPTRFQLKLVDELGINQTRSFQIPTDVGPGSYFEYKWGVLGFGEVQNVFVKESNGRVEGPWYFVEQVAIGESCFDFIKCFLKF